MRAVSTTERKSALRPVSPAPEEPRRYESLGYRAKRILLGPPYKTAQLAHERISKRVALAVFSSDPISSTAYATEEMLIVLTAAGTAAIGLALPLAAGVAVLLLIRVLSYRQVIAAYPRGGGAYMVSRDNLGNLLAAVCGAALLIDYVLTVAVSVSAGTASLASAVEPLRHHRVELSIAFVLLLMWGNLRGIRESGRIFAIPTYVYIASLGGVIVYGIFKAVFGQLEPVTYQAEEAAQLANAGTSLAAVSLFLLLHAYAAGTTALTGVEAIADGVPAFRRPEARNAQKTLTAMALIMGTLFIVVLAANTAFNGFPVLASFAAEDALMPRQLRKRGHRLVSSNGIIMLAAGA